MSFGGTLFYLTLYGFCPCLEKEEDKSARSALQHINAVGQRILLIQSSSSRRSSATEFIGSLFKRSESDASSKSKGTAGDVEARLTLQDDAENGEPEIFVNPKPILQGQTPTASSNKLNIALRRVHKINIEGNDIILYAKQLEQGQPPKELLRFVALEKTAVDATPITDDQRNMLVHNLSVLIEWERQRRRAAGFDEEEDYEEDGPSFIAVQAKKATHFAKRELELQQTKRDRDKRKAKLVAESGGLKYTALAMATRGESA